MKMTRYFQKQKSKPNKISKYQYQNVTHEVRPHSRKFSNRQQGHRS